MGAERICMKKVVSEETLEYDEEERCHHVTKQNCYQVFKTVYKKAVVSSPEKTTRRASSQISGNPKHYSGMG